MLFADWFRVRPDTSKTMLSFRRGSGLSLLVVIASLLASSLTAAGSPVRALPKFQLKLVDGTTINSSGLAGKVTVIDFWGTWCKPCLAEIPGYNAFYQDYKAKGVVFLALAADSGTADEVKAAARRLKMEYPVAAPSWEELDLFGNIEVFPTTMVFDGKGRLVKEYYGVAPGKAQSLRAIVERLLSEK